METPAIDIQNMHFSRNGQNILRDIHLTVNRGDFLAVIGPNGGGKTTLLKLILGIYNPQGGSVRVLGGRPRKNAHRIGYIPQDVGLNRKFPITVLEVVLMGRLKPGRWSTYRYTAEDRDRAKAELKSVDMVGFENRRIGDTSGGQRQRVYIARALAGDPEILLLDEPTASIDVQGQKEFYEILKSLNEKITIVLVSHDFMVLSSYAGSVACVNKNLHYHDEGEITEEMTDMYQCPVEIVAHGLPHRVLKPH